MADKRAYFKLDVGYMTNPKVLAVLDESPTAILLHIASIGYAAQHLTDGVVPVKALLRMTGASAEDADLLRSAGLWIDGPTKGQAEVHDYLQHQRSAAEVKGASEKGKRAASARWHASSNAPSNASRMHDASETAMPREEREEREETPSSAAADGPTDTLDDDFTEWYTAYPRKVGKQAAIKAYRKARKIATRDAILDGLRRQLPKLAAAEVRFQPHPATWLNEGRWEDEDGAAPQVDDNNPWGAPRTPPDAPPEIADDPVRYAQWLDDWRREQNG